MLIGVALSGVTGGVKSDSNFEFALKLPVNVASLLLVSMATVSFAMVLFSKFIVFF